MPPIEFKMSLMTRDNGFLKNKKVSKIKQAIIMSMMTVELEKVAMSFSFFS